MRTFVRHNSILDYISRRIRKTASHWRRVVLTGVCMLGISILSAGLGLVMWAFISLMTLLNMSQTVPLTSIR